MSQGKPDRNVAGESDPDRYLIKRDGWWHYYRRVPVEARPFDKRTFSRKSLKTRSLEIAQIRRNAMEEADDLFWSSVSVGGDQASATERYEAARKRARALGFVYKTVDEITETASISEVVERALATVGRGPAIAESALGGVRVPDVPVSEAINLYIREIAVQDTRGYSPRQKASWAKVKRRAAQNFIKVVGDIDVLSIARSDAQEFWRWWNARVESEGRKPNTARRDFGNMRRLFHDYAKWSNVEALNPFDGLTFRETKFDSDDRPSFSTEWIRNRFLVANAFDALNEEARDIFLTLIETGCRPSEICNLQPDDIHIDAAIPFIGIRFRADRALKTDSSEREIPLVGVSLAAMRRHPGGFPRYRDKGDGFSQLMMKYLRRHDLLETPDHVVYSIRHSFEDRMKEANLHYDFRCAVMGHVNDRPEYGEGGSMKWRRDQLNQIVLPYDAGA